MPSSIPRKSGKAAEQQPTSKRTTITSNEARPRSTPIDAQHQIIPQPPTDLTTIPIPQAARTVVQQIADNETFNQNAQHTTPPRNDTRGASPSSSSSPEGPSSDYLDRLERLANLQERLAVFPQRRGNKYGRVTLKGKSRALQGNIYDKDNLAAIILSPSNEYAEGEAQDSGQFFNGNADPTGARAFFESGIVPEQSDEEEDAYEEDGQGDHEMGGTRGA